MRLLTLSVTGALVASLCAAAPLTVTLSGHATGTFVPLNSTTPQGFVNTPFTFSFTADTTSIDTFSNAPESGNTYQTAFVPGAVTIDGMSGAFSTNVSIQVNYPYINFGRLSIT
jgi:hypothetical protein